MVDTDTLLRRMLLFKPSEADYFNYELSPYPSSIFKDGIMRKNKKSDLYDFFEPIDENII